MLHPLLAASQLVYHRTTSWTVYFSANISTPGKLFHREEEGDAMRQVESADHDTLYSVYADKDHFGDVMDATKEFMF